ncbi:MAG: diaminopimelate epimerase [Flavobacteriaceae bacterium]|nr:diaminopimelate epimerase [Flavobacteriaceae bacterium]|tara:strand:+ start:13287 stop:14069 length:783 start_codon:yes stop_codon:yes gene_type:complete
MELKFKKYHAAGNDFVLIDNRHNNFSFGANKIQNICNRNLGIGADGFILLNKNKKFNFEMVYFNSDGIRSTMCGNGARCFVAFANKIGLIDEKIRFLAYDGVHEGFLIDKNFVKLTMCDVSLILQKPDFIYLDTGSPHHIIPSKDLEEINVKLLGSKIRFSDIYKKQGVNVNFVEKISSDKFKIRTYERGVENETLSCGTGAVASAIAMSLLGETSSKEIKISTLGGKLFVAFNKRSNNKFTNVTLEGPVKFVYEGTIII